MIPKYLRLCRPHIIMNHFYPFSAVRRSSKPIAKLAVVSSITQESLTQYKNQRSAINKELATHLVQLQSLSKKSGKHLNQICVFLANELSSMDLSSLSSMNLQAIRKLLEQLKDEKDQAKIQPLINQIHNKLAIIQKEGEADQSSLPDLIKIYQSSQSDEIAQQIIRKLKRNPVVQIELVNSFFQLLQCSPSASESERQVRLLFLRTVKGMLPTLSLKDLAAFGAKLNSVSHYDFSDEQLAITDQYFKKMKEKSINFNEQTIDFLFKAKQHLPNKLSLSNFYLSFIKDIIIQIKKFNSADAQRLFALICMSHKKLDLKAFQELKGHQFLLKYVLVSGSTKKHNKAINAGLENLIPYLFTPATTKLLSEVLQQIQCKISARVLYELSIKGISVEPLIKSIPTDDLTLQQTIFTALAIHRSSKLHEKLDQVITSHLDSMQKFFELLATLKQISTASNLLENFDKVFGSSIRNLYALQRNGMKDDQQLIFLQYFTFSLRYAESELTAFRLYLENVPNHVVYSLIEELLKSKSNNIGRTLFLLKHKNSVEDKKVSIKVLLRMIQYANEQTLRKEENNEFWKQIASCTYEMSNVYNEEIISSECNNLFKTLLRKYNSHEGYFKTGHFWKVIQSLSKCIKRIPQLQQSVVKHCIYFSIYNRDISDISERLESGNLIHQQRQKLRLLRDSSYSPSIQSIDESTLPIILNNVNLHYLLKQQSVACHMLIRNSNINALYNYIINLSGYMNENNHKIFTTIIDQFTRKVDLSQIYLFPVINAISRLELTITQSCRKFMETCIEYLISTPIHLTDYRVQLRVLTIISCLGQPIHIAESYIKLLLNLAKHEAFQIKKSIFKKSIFTNYSFQDTSELQIFLDFPLQYHFPYFFLLEPYFTNLQKEKILLKIVQTLQNHDNSNRNLELMSILQYRFLKKKYAEQTKNLNLSENELISDKITEFYQKDVELLNKFAAYHSMSFSRDELQGNQFFWLNGTIVMFVNRDMHNRIHELSYYYRLLKTLFDGPDTKVTIMLGFPRALRFVDINVKFDSLTSKYGWHDFFNSLNKQNQEELPLNSENSSTQNQTKRSGESFNVSLNRSQKRKGTLIRSQMRR